MPIYKLNELSVGMIIADDIRSYAGQIIVRKNSVLTRQMIGHLKYYSIPQVEIYEGEISKEIKKALDNQHNVEATHLKRLLNSQEYKEFKKTYTNNVSVLENSVNDIILKNAPVQPKQLLHEIITIFDTDQSYFSLFGMLHSMKHIDDSTYAHSVNVAIISRMIGTWNNFDSETLDQLTLAGLLHDIGKCQIPDHILLKPRKLTKQEFEFVKMHSQFGYNILKNQDLDPRVKNAALFHHERCDGSGYPLGITIKELHEFDCIVSIADVYDALTANRCYRNGLCPFEVISIFESEGLHKYHPKYIKSFLRKIAESYLNHDVLLSNGKRAKILYINSRPTRPFVQFEDGTYLNLVDAPDIYIQAII